ncbi:MAG: fibronectin type III domain-containing protein, partial [Oscillospiraceae bacterium]|nr:fibronectin type III domain-containing protein [Oscillospiraceae bacterium]
LLNATIHYNYKSPISNLKATATSNSAKLTWSKTTSASYYKVFVYQNSKWNQLAKVTTNSYTATSLNPSTSYKYRVSAYNSSNKLLAYSDVTVKTPAGKLANLKGSTSSTNTAKLTWSKPTSASYYKVFVYQNNKWNQLTKVTSTSYTATKLSANTSYKFRVSAYNSGNKLLAYSDTTVKTLANVANLKATATSNSAKLTWSKPTSASYYKVFVYQNNKWNQLTKVTSTSYTATKLSANTSYKYRVSAYNSSNKLLAYSDVTAKTAFASITNLKATATSNSAKLTWSKPTSASYYKVFVYQNNKWNQLTKVTSISYTATKLSTNTSYKYRVSAYNSGNKLIAYSDVTVKTK